MDNKFKTWTELFEAFDKVINEPFETKISFVKDIIKNKKVPVAIKLFDVETVDDYINSSYFTTGEELEKSAEVWKSYFAIRDFFIIANYLSLTYSFEDCTYENWCFLTDGEFFKIFEEGLDAVSEDYKDFVSYFDTMIDINIKYHNYELIAGVTSSLESIPKDLQAGELMAFLEKNPDFMGNLYDLLRFNNPKNQELLDLMDEVAQEATNNIKKEQK